MKVFGDGSKRFFEGIRHLQEKASAQVVEAWSTSNGPSGRPAQAGGATSSSPIAASGGGDAASRHPRFFVPGQIIHLYQQDGLARAAMAPCTHDTFARICPSQGMLEDHKMSAYDEAVRQACIQKPQTPRWQAFEDREVCTCCEADFNWGYVLKSEPQRMLARHHCFACGAVVCDGCSERRRAQPQLGFVEPVRTCDRCFFAGDSSAD